MGSGFETVGRCIIDRGFMAFFPSHFFHFTVDFRHWHRGGEILQG
jgi:hypothetical protein